ncbi:hypothetical protein ABTM86_18970, partial [Acinetobacter baumannii]
WLDNHIECYCSATKKSASPKLSSDTSAATIKKNSEEIALKIANKMKDSLSLNKEEAKKIYEINLWLQAKKMEARKVHAGSPTLVSQKIQQIENMRDS